MRIELEQVEVYSTPEGLVCIAQNDDRNLPSIINLNPLQIDLVIEVLLAAKSDLLDK